MLKKLIIEELGKEDFVAFFAAAGDIEATGMSPAEAVGNLLLTNQPAFQVEIVEDYLV